MIMSNNIAKTRVYFILVVCVCVCVCVSYISADPGGDESDLHLHCSNPFA